MTDLNDVRQNPDDYKAIFTDFKIEANCKSLEACWRQFPQQLLKDPQATANEKMLAMHFLKMAEVMDKLVSDLDYGICSVRVPASKVRIVPDE